jgi:flagellar motility protein MotE (MotC chaperone)
MGVTMNAIRKIIMVVVLMGAFSGYAQDEFIPPLDPQRMEQMEAVRIWKMTEFLDLDTDQSTQFFPRLKEHEKRIREIQDKQREIMMEICRETDNEASQISQADIENYAQKIAKLEKNIINEKETFINSVGDILSERQQAKFIIFENKFRNRLMRSLYHPHNSERPHYRKDE